MNRPKNVSTKPPHALPLKSSAVADSSSSRLAWIQMSYWGLPSLFIVGLSLWVLFARSLMVYDFTLDDSFITYRYSKHLIDGIGLIWNPGESPPVEGYTTFLWVIINAIFELFRIDPVEGSKLLSFAALLVMFPLFLLSPTFVHTLGMLPTNLQEKSGVDALMPPISKSLTLLPAILGTSLITCALWVSADTPAHVVSGMETMFAGLLLLIFAMALGYIDVIYLWVLKQDHRWSHTTWIALGLMALSCGMIRPEFNLGVGLGFSLSWVIQRFWVRDKNISTLLLKAIGLYVVLGLIYYVWRYAFYGLPFPLPFYIKQLQPSHELLKGLVTMKGFFNDYALYFWLALAGLILSPKRLLPAGIMGVSILIYFLFPDHIMGIYMRFPYPILPIMMWLSINAIHRVMSWQFLPSPLWTLGLPVMAFTLVLGQPNPSKKPSQNSWDLPNENVRWLVNRAWMQDYRDSEHRSLIPFGKAIGRARAEGQRPMKIAMVDLGAVAYYGDWPMLDLFGLTHPKLALARSRGKYSADMLLDESPDIVLLGEFYREPRYRGQFSFESELYHRMNAYQYVPAVRFIWNRLFGFLVFAKNEDIKNRFADILRQSSEIAPSLQILPNLPLDELPPHPYASIGR